LSTVWWEGYPINLCGSCLDLGDGEPKTATVVADLLAHRANPEAPTTGFEARVRRWIEEALMPFSEEIGL
jgi:hypothetical protein